MIATVAPPLSVLVLFFLVVRLAGMTNRNEP